MLEKGRRMVGLKMKISGFSSAIQDLTLLVTKATHAMKSETYEKMWMTKKNPKFGVEKRRQEKSLSRLTTALLERATHRELLRSTHLGTLLVCFI
ncbi:uncharacterized protein LOC144908523 isoform X2 [Branchiostoma floridae x Branchiostoma belcheri]